MHHSRTIKVTPVLKKGDQEKFENYRPVSILPIFGKIFEKIIYSRLYDYLTSKGILYGNQFGPTWEKFLHGIPGKAHLLFNKIPIYIYLDSKLSFNEHIKHVTKKATTSLMQCSKAVGLTWGLTPRSCKWIYEKAIRPILSCTMAA